MLNSQFPFHFSFYFCLLIAFNIALSLAKSAIGLNFNDINLFQAKIQTYFGIHLNNDTSRNLVNNYYTHINITTVDLLSLHNKACKNDIFEESQIGPT